MDSGVGTLAESTPVVLIFIAAALLFAPSVFRTVGGTLYGWLGEIGGIEGVEPF